MGSSVGGALVGLLCVLAHRPQAADWGLGSSQETALWSVVIWPLGNFGERGTEVPAPR